MSAVATFGGLIHSCTVPNPTAAQCPHQRQRRFGSSGVRSTSALYRRYFQPDGTLAPFVLGEGTSNPVSAHSITNGGSGDDTSTDLLVLAPEAERGNGFLYLDFDATPNLNLYVQGLAGKSMTDQPDHGGRFAAVSGIDTRITIFRENAFLPAAVRQIMVNENCTSFQMNVVGDREGLGRESRVKQDNKTYSGTVGLQVTVRPRRLLQRLAASTATPSTAPRTTGATSRASS